MDSIIEILGFVFALFFSYKTYGFFAGFLASNFSIARSWSALAGFFIAWFISEIIFFLVSHKFISRYIKKINSHLIFKFLGLITAFFQASFLFIFFISLIFSLPTRGSIKKDILNSRTGPYFVRIASNFERGIKQVFGGAINETINFLTIERQSNESIAIDVVPEKTELTIDEVSERTMFDLVNGERIKIGLNTLTYDADLQKAARDYAREMFENGFFSHLSKVNGSEPKDRAERAGVDFYLVGENLAYAPEVYIAHQGLMNSQGHRENILLKDFGRLGVGVVDGGFYGKMFVQMFAD